VYEDVDPLTDASPDADARQQVTALFEAHALGLVKLAKVMLGDQSMAEDVVQDAFVGMYRKWASMQDRDKALGYLRTSVLNGCRTAHRNRTRRDRALLLAPSADGIVSAEESALVGEANREVLAALRALPARQRLRVLYQYTGTCYYGVDTVLWSDNSARHVIGESLTVIQGNPSQHFDRYGVAAGGKFAKFQVAQHGQWYSGPAF
jgi:RNA polymerase sigma factor (sigma-70 family)